MGVAEEAMIASVVEYGWSGRLVILWQDNREKVLECIIELCSHD